MENIHFQVDYNVLSLIFIESPDMENPNVQPIVFAKLLDIGNVETSVTDLEKFRADIEILQGTEISDLGITTTTKAKGFPGFQIPLSVGLLTFIAFKRRNKRK